MKLCINGAIETSCNVTIINYIRQSLLFEFKNLSVRLGRLGRRLRRRRWRCAGRRTGGRSGRWRSSRTSTPTRNRIIYILTSHWSIFLFSRVFNNFLPDLVPNQEYNKTNEMMALLQSFSARD